MAGRSWTARVPVPVASGWSSIVVVPDGAGGTVKNVRARLDDNGAPGVSDLRIALASTLRAGIFDGLLHGAGPDDLALDYDNTLGAPATASNTAQINLGAWGGDFDVRGGITVGVDFTKSNPNAGILYVRVDVSE